MNCPKVQLIIINLPAPCPMRYALCPMLYAKTGTLSEGSCLKAVRGNTIHAVFMPLRSNSCCF